MSIDTMVGGRRKKGACGKFRLLIVSLPVFYLEMRDSCPVREMNKGHKPSKPPETVPDQFHYVVDADL
jgi:hypothetical protein